MKYIELNTFLKIHNLATTGGEAKTLIRSEEVKVNDEIETRNKRKLVAGDRVGLAGIEYIVSDKECREKDEHKKE